MDRKYIIDTDIGDDIDDAFAVAQALEYGLDVIGVTTVFRNVEERAQIARKLLEACGRRDIPVFSGLGKGLKGELRTDEHLCQWMPELVRYREERDGDGKRAVDFLLDAAAKYKRKLTVIAIGPLTNIAAAIRKAPEIMSGIGKILLMGGDYSRQYCEWNILCDVEAANVVFSSECSLVCIGYDVTVLTRMKEEEEKLVLKMKGRDGEESYLKELYMLWRKEKNEKIRLELHDPLTVYYEIAPSAFCMKESEIFLETGGDVTRGMTVDAAIFERRMTGKRTLFAVGADISRFKRQFFERVCRLSADEN